MTRNHLATILGIAPTLPPAHDRRDTDRPRALVYVEAGRVELHAIAADGIVLEPGDARLLAAELMRAADQAGR